MTADIADPLPLRGGRVKVWVKSARICVICG